MSAKTIIEIVLSSMALITAYFVAQAKVKEAKAKKRDPSWQPNPKRCQEERDRIVALEGQNNVWATRFDNVDAGIERLETGLGKLTDLHLKG